MTLIRGGMGRPSASRVAAVGVSNNPYRGRGGRSGVTFSLATSDADIDRPRVFEALSLFLPKLRSFCGVGEFCGVLGVAYS